MVYGDELQFGFLAYLLTSIAIFIASAAIYGLILYFTKFKRIIEITRNIPSGPTWPIIGHAHHFIGVPAHMMLQRIWNLSQENLTDKKYMKIWLGPELNLITSDLKDIEIILGGIVHNEKAGEYKVLEPWLKEGLLISRGRKWHMRRKLITGAFHFQILPQFIDNFENESRVMIAELEKAVCEGGNKAEIHLYELISLCTLDVICESAMGVSVHAQTNADSEYVRAVKTISTVLHKRMFDILYRFNLTYQFTKLARDEKKALAILHGFTEKIIVQRREELLKAKDTETQSQIDDVGSKRKMAFLDILLQSEIDGKPLSNLDIREEVDTFMFEGHDTTSSAITFCLYNLALYPKCQQKCFEEIIQVFGKDKSKPVTYEDLNNLHYVELCIKETLRMFPSVPLLGRKVTEECEINGKIVPAGTNIGISPLHLGRQEELFPDPNTFKPERFEMDYTTDKMSPYAYIPFSAGPRNCIGQKFAMLEIKTVLTNVLRHYELDYAGNKDEELLLIAELILRPKDPLMFKITPRVY
ncbi:cytochrome P450 4d1 isoform X1 [Calliphora vicina]|uniref:cytochrome P450 4d1 isoform X1 n=1 Tax=Calliphora vicina TaxID=7373 RepID=UPI00325B5033